MTQRRRLQLRYARIRHWRKRAAAFIQSGLTTRGTNRQYRVFPLLAGLHGKNRKRAYQRIRRRELTEQGLTQRGNPNPHAPSVFERAWREWKRQFEDVTSL